MEYCFRWREVSETTIFKTQKSLYLELRTHYFYKILPVSEFDFGHVSPRGTGVVPGGSAASGCAGCVVQLGVSVTEVCRC